MWDASDEALLAGLAIGDQEAAVVFVRRFQAKVFGLALLITGNPTDADEVAQEAFVRAWKYGASYDARRGSVTRWLLGITRNVALDRTRVTRRSPEQPFAVVPEDALVDFLDMAESVGMRDDAKRIAEHMCSLPPEQRSALLAVTLQGLSAREVSESSGIPLGTVKTRIRLGLQKLRVSLGDRVP